MGQKFPSCQKETLPVLCHFFFLIVSFLNDDGDLSIVEISYISLDGVLKKRQENCINQDKKKQLKIAEYVLHITIGICYTF